MPVAPVVIRPATDDDWVKIWPFFSLLVEAGETYTYPQNIPEGVAREAWMQQPPGQTVVAVDGETVLGTAKVVPNQTGRGAHIANASFMVDPAHAGRGVGRALAANVIDLARSAGYTAMQFNAVVETNTVAVRLWQSLGFDILATIPEAFDHPAHGLVGMHVMHRLL